jgi:HD-GYP domain-containing protein (c-di-GMP phosphodiesterase class II)
MQTLSIHDAKPRLVGIVLLVLTLGVLGFAMVSRFAASDLERDMKIWQEKLNLIADSRASEVNHWVEHHFTEMKKLADQPALQLYLTELSTIEKTSNATAEAPQRTYLRNLITFTADRLNFTPTNVPLSVQHIPSQLPYTATSGLALLNAAGDIVVASSYLSALPEPITQRMQGMPKTMHSLIDIYKSENNEAMLGFVQPILGIQDDTVVGQMVGIKPIADAFSSLLKHPGITERTLEILLVRSENGNVVYLSPTQDGGEPLTKQVSNNPATLAEAFAIASPNAFTERTDYSSTPVLVTGRAIANTPWTLVVKISAKEALHDSNLRRQGMVLLLSAVIALVLVTLVAVWYSASSRRALHESAQFKVLADAATSHERLLTLVTQQQLESVFLLDSDMRYRFANRAAADTANIDPDQMIGKTAADVLGPARASELTLHAQAALASLTSQSYLHRMMRKEGEIILHTQMIPLAALPIPELNHMAGVLVSEQDITELVHQRERAERTHQELVSTLVAMVDQRDPHAYNHSKLVAELTHEIALSLDCTPLIRDTAKTAGLLLNIGKIVVPETMLTSTDRLNELELKAIRESVYASANILKGVRFEGPVMDTINQSLEHVDGTGPQGLKGDAILLSARIIAAANALVGMISPRAYRSAMSIKEATSALLEQVDAVYDRKVVFALVNFLENQGGAAMLQQWMETRKAA